ncbi:hypothetical protein HAX54_032607, partial [Datura stramonium]|nr:hypothetical protein [Datura stramonium]
LKYEITFVGRLNLLRVAQDKTLKWHRIAHANAHGRGLLRAWQCDNSLPRRPPCSAERRLPLLDGQRLTPGSVPIPYRVALLVVSREGCLTRLVVPVLLLPRAACNANVLVPRAAGRAGMAL